MSTRSIIIQKMPGEETVRAVYCHHDGHIKDGVGEILRWHYTDPEKINRLMDSGDMSQLGESLDDTAFYNEKGNVQSYPSVENVLHEWREEADEAAKESSTIEYFYFHDGEKWNVIDNTGGYDAFEENFKPLSEYGE